MSYHLLIYFPLKSGFDLSISYNGLSLLKNDGLPAKQNTMLKNYLQSLPNVEDNISSIYSQWLFVTINKNLP